MTDGSHLNKVEWCQKHDFLFSSCGCRSDERPEFKDRIYRDDDVAKALRRIYKASDENGPLTMAINELVNARIAESLKP